MLPLALAGFVAGAFVLQQMAALPPAAGLLAWMAVPVPAWALARAAPWRWLPPALVLLAAGAVGFAYAGLAAQWRMADELAFADEGRDVRVVGVVASLPAQLERGVRFEFAVESSEDAHVPARISLGWFGPQASVRPAERWAFTVRLRRPHGTLNPGGFDLEAWLLERNLRATGHVHDGRAGEAPRRLERRVLQPGPLVDLARDALRTELQQRLAGSRYGGVLVALVLGDQRAIREDDWLLFNRTGISHLVSISGLHITMIAGLAALAMGALWRRSQRLLQRAPAQTAAAVAGMLAAFAYCLLAGWGVPAQRTFFMLATVALAMLSRLALRPTLTLAVAAGVVTLLDPWAVLAPGFWLSFGAVAAILYALAGRLQFSAPHWRARLAQAARVQLAVTVALVPLTIVLFQQVSVVSPLANAVAIPVVSLLVTPLALLGALFVALPDPLASLAVPALAFAHALFAGLAEVLVWAAAVPGASISLAAPPWWTLPLAAAGVAWLLAPAGWPVRWAGAFWLLPMLLWPPQRPGTDELWVTALDVGQGSAVLVESGGRALLYDAGPRFSAQSDAGGRIIAPYLRWRGIHRLDLLVISHLDSDHSGGAAALLRALPVERVLTSIDRTQPMLVGAPVVTRCIDGERIELAPLRLEVLHPTTADYARSKSTNAMSCVVRVDAAGRSVLLTGDVPAREELELLQRVAPAASLAADLLIAPHHGSRTSSSAELLAAARPAWVGVQAGYRNRFGHPDPQVLARYQSAQAAVARTDEGGALQWRLKGDGTVQASSWRVDGRRYWHNQPGALRGLRQVSESADDGAEATAAQDPEPDAARPVLD